MQLTIGQTIRELRKQLDITQDELADAVGVSIAAVSKWESGKSYPDITLLPSLARRLQTSIDHLLDYGSKLSVEELDQITRQCARVFDSESFEQGYALCQRYLQQYPDDLALKLHIGTLLPMYLHALSTEEIQKYLDAALELCKPAAACSDPALHQLATRMLATIHLMSGRLDLAEEYMHACLQDVDGEVDPTLAIILLKKGEVEKAAQMYQRYLFRGMNDSLAALTGLAGISASQTDETLYLKYQQTILQLSALFDLQEQPGFHMNTSLSLAHFYAQKQRTAEMLEALQNYVACVEAWDSSLDLSHNDFFFRMDASENALSYDSTMKAANRETAAQLRAYEFIRGNPRFEELLSRLEK